MTNPIDRLLQDNDVECALSIAYVHAIAAQAGYLCGPAPEPDRDSVDVQIAAGGAMRPKLDIQLKASICLQGSEDAFSYPLKIKNYEDLRITTQTPRLLVVLDLPRENEERLRVSVNELVLRRAAYWACLQGQRETANASSVSIQMPRKNIFDVRALGELMEKSRSGTII